MKKIRLSSFIVLVLLFFITDSCSKGGGDPPPANPCAGVTVTVAGTSTNVTTTGGTDGTISATATGGSGITFSLNNGAFQASGNFTGLAAGNYTVTAKTANGCTGTRSFSITEPGACVGVNIVVTATSTGAVPCQTPANGTITATATGSAGITYSIDGTNFQSSGNFTGVGPGNYTVTARTAAGCTGTVQVTVAAANAGPLFTAVRTLLDNNCVSCHNAGNSNGGMNWAVDCNVVANKDRIKARAVDNNPSSMPPGAPLSQADKNKITNWINAGGRFTD